VSIRYQLNSLKMISKKAYFAGGCFWGVEYYFQNLAGVISTSVGYMGGKTEKPTYEEVCNNSTGHAETLEVSYNPEVVTYQELAKLFFEIHDPTQFNHQGPDFGDQYRSAIFYIDQEQKNIAEELIKQLVDKGFNVVTKVLPANSFWPAEDYNQRYYEKNGKTPYCHFRTKRFDEA
jgi:peptide methionine sulfoxide reductase msrA/msrB